MPASIEVGQYFILQYIFIDYRPMATVDMGFTFIVSIFAYFVFDLVSSNCDRTHIVCFAMSAYNVLKVYADLI